jgi:protein phosphatase
MATSADESTPAARASALHAAPRPAAPEPPSTDGPPSRDDNDRPRRHPVRTTVLLVVLLALLGGGLWAGWRVTQSQYYVGATDDGKLAVFQGVPGQIAGVDLSNVHHTSNTELDELTPVAQERVKQGIQAKNQADAERRLVELTRDEPGNPNRKPPCPTAPSATASAEGPVPPTGVNASTTASASALAGSPTSTVEPLPTDEPEPTMAVDPADCLEPN